MSGDTYFSITLGGLSLLFLVLFGIISNSLAIHYFSKQIRSHVLSRIFCTISLTDLLTSALTLFVALCYCEGRGPSLFDNSTFREVWGSLWNLSSRYSVYLVAVISITRTVRIAFPFTPLKTQLLNVGLAWYAVFLIATTPAFYNVTHYYKSVWCAVALNKSQFVEAHDAKYYMIVMSIPSCTLFLLPLVMTSAGVCIYKIHKHIDRVAKRRQKRNSIISVRTPPNTDGAVRSAITIVIFTLIYLTLNIPYCAIYLYVQIQSARLSLPPPLVIPDTHVKRYLTGFTHVLSISINAALNPVLYYWRMSDFRDYVNNLIGRNARMAASVFWSSNGGVGDANFVVAPES